MSARHMILAAATACTLFSAAGAAASSADATVRPASGFPAAHGFTGAAGPPTSAECMKALGIACYSPRQVERAYDLPPLYARGLDGRGRTIVIVDPFGSPTLRHDLRVLQPVGKVPPFNPKNPAMVDKAGETTEDVEWAHAIAPGADILVAETPVAETTAGGGFPQFMAAEDYVIRHHLGDVISQSFSLPEQNFPSRAALLRLRYAYRDARRHHVTVLAASNDLGAAGVTPAGTGYLHPVVWWPASDPLVTGVGGTRLHLNATGNRTSPDTAWNDSRNTAVAKVFGALPWASGGGLSVVFPRPAYQDPVRGVTGNRRGVPDVAMSGSLSGAVIAFESYSGAPGQWFPTGGTSGATPEFAGIVAIADQYAHKKLGFINPALYRLEQEHAPGLVDVTKGSNTVSFTQGGKTITIKGYRARPGYDLVTGVGTIDAARFVRELARTG